MRNPQQNQQDYRQSTQGRGAQRRYQSDDAYSGDDNNFGTGYTPDYQGQGREASGGSEFEQDRSRNFASGQRRSPQGYGSQDYGSQNFGSQGGRSQGGYGQGSGSQQWRGSSDHEDFEREHYWNQDRPGYGSRRQEFSGGDRYENEGRYGSGGRQEGGYDRYGGGMYGISGDRGYGSGGYEGGNRFGSSGGSYGGSNFGSGGSYGGGSAQFGSSGSDFQSGNFYGRSSGMSGGYGMGQGSQSGQSSYGSQGAQGFGQRGSQQSSRKGPKGYTRSDERVKEDVCDRLTDAYDLDVENISIEVKDGKVTLTGTVPERHMKHRVEDIASMCTGVKDVENQVRVAQSQGSDNESGTTSATGTSGASGTQSGSQSSSKKRDH